MGYPVETIAEQLFYTTVYIETWSDDGYGTGTGFLVSYEVADGTMPILVTNKHVLEGAQAARFRTVEAGSDGNPSSRAQESMVEDFRQEGKWIGHPKSHVDVAVMPFGPVQATLESHGNPAFTKSFSPDMLLTNQQARELDAIEEVLFVGYPNGLYDTASWLPVARRGQTATPIRNNYQSMPAFLIDASVFPGSSGSPVVLYDRGMYVDRQGNTNMGRGRFHLIGVVAAVHTREVRGEIVLTTGRPTAQFRDMIDLGLVFKANAIQECVNRLMQKFGVQIKKAPQKKNLA